MKQERALGLVLLGVLLGAWEVVARLEVVSPRFFPPISDVLLTFLQLSGSLALPLDLAKSLSRMFGGLFLAVALMVPLGFLMARVRLAHNLSEPLLEMLRPLSAPAIIPVVMLFLGIGNAMKIFVVFYACAFPILINTVDGVRGVDPLFVQTARTYGATGQEIMRKVILPAAWPQIFGGLRTSLPIALIVVITSELIGGNDGLGFFILNNMRNFYIRESYAGLLMVGLVGYGLNRLAVILDGKFMAWDRKGRD